MMAKYIATNSAMMLPIEEGKFLIAFPNDLAL
jgi:hypothetical protein